MEGAQPFLHKGAGDLGDGQMIAVAKRLAQRFPAKIKADLLSSRDEGG